MCTKESRILYGAAKPLPGQQRLFTKKPAPQATNRFCTDEGSLLSSMGIAVLLLRGYILKGPWLISDVQTKAEVALTH
jgi:hypothetical protein